MSLARAGSASATVTDGDTVERGQRLGVEAPDPADTGQPDVQFAIGLADHGKRYCKRSPPGE